MTVPVAAWCRWTISEVRRGASVRSALQLRSAEPRDAGEYRCHARNPHGRAVALMLLTVEGALLASPVLTGRRISWFCSF